MVRKKLLFFIFCISYSISIIPQIPGYDQVGAGFDGTTLEYRQLPILELTWDSNNIWNNPIYPDLQYLYPNEFIIQNDVASLLVDGSIVYKDIDDYQTKITHSHTHHGFLGFGSSSKTTVDYYRRYYELDQSLVFSYQYHAWYKITVPPLPPPILHPLTLKFLKSLPTTYNSDKKSKEFSQYRTFIDLFGTHYVDSAIMGGMIKMTTWYHRCLLYTYSEHWVNKQSGWSFLGFINSRNGHSKYDANISQLWLENTVSSTIIAGGDSVTYQPNEYQDWIMTIKEDPVPIFYTLTPISDIIPDPVIQNNMKQAILDYFIEANKTAEQLKQSLIPKNPLPLPSWCKNFPPVY
jgi:hypothetical protein